LITTIKHPAQRAAILVLAILSMLLPLSATAKEPVSKSRLGGVAIGGHDTTAYHEAQVQSAVVKGVKSWVVKWKGAKWRFASKESAEKFDAEPERFAPAFNGFCANALSLGKGLLKTDGTHWEIIDDRLFLFYAASGRDRWVGAGDEVGKFIDAAEAAWMGLK